MSLDYPLYQELCRRQHPGAKWWRFGDALYYVGLLPALMLVLPALVALIRLPFGIARWQVAVLFLLALFAGVFILGTRLKRKAWTMAARDGIKVNDY
jgi:hypothetical protein